jgi:hypothetical protein
VVERMHAVKLCHAAARALVGWYLMYPYDYTRAGPVAGYVEAGATVTDCAGDEFTLGARSLYGDVSITTIPRG